MIALPAEPFREAAVTPGGWFVLITHRRTGGELVQVQVRRIAAPGGAASRATTPRVYLKEGRSVTTRR